MVSKDNEAAAVVRLLRYLEREYRSLGGGSERKDWHVIEDVKFRLRNELGRALNLAYRAGRLPSLIVDQIRARDREHEACGRAPTLEFSLPAQVIGYVKYGTIGYDCGPDRRVLKPGSVHLVWPEIFSPIALNESEEDRNRAKATWLDDDDDDDDDRLQSINGTAIGSEDASSELAVLGRYAEACHLLADWIESHFGDRLAEPVADEIEGGDRVDRDAIGSAALNAVVSGGLAGVLQAAVGTRSVDRVTAIITERVAADRRLYERRAEDWAAELKVTKKTVTDSDGWREIMKWRAANRADRVSKKTGK